MKALDRQPTPEELQRRQQAYSDAIMPIIKDICDIQTCSRFRLIISAVTGEQISMEYLYTPEQQAMMDRAQALLADMRAEYTQIIPVNSNEIR